MATDLRYYYGNNQRHAFHLFLNSADATGNGVAVVPAVAGASIYVSGYTIGNDTGGALIFTGQANAGAATHVPITPDIHVGTVTSKTVNYHEPLGVGENRDFGFVASGAGEVGFEVWGYYAAPTETPEEVSASASKMISMSKSTSRSKSRSKSQSMSQSISQSRSQSQSKSQSLSQSVSQSASQFGSRSQSKSQSRSQYASRSQSKSQSMSQSASVQAEQ